LHSRDGLTFRYIGGDRRPWATRGEMGGVPLPTVDGLNPEAAWDSGMVATVRGIINRDGVIRMYKWGDALVRLQIREVPIILSRTQQHAALLWQRHGQCDAGGDGTGLTCRVPRDIGSTAVSPLNLANGMQAVWCVGGGGIGGGGGGAITPIGCRASKGSSSERVDSPV
jgi:hypothetical protein